MAEAVEPKRAEHEPSVDADQLTDEDLEVVAGAGGHGPPPFVGDWSDMGMAPPELTDPSDWFG